MTGILLAVKAQLRLRHTSVFSEANLSGKKTKWKDVERIMAAAIEALRWMSEQPYAPANSVVHKHAHW